jgi:hypothetical protein
MKRFLVAIISLILFSGAAAMAQGEAGIGFEYGGGYLLPLNDYDMRSIQSFLLTMDVTSDLSVSIFREVGTIRGENSYTGEDDGSTGTTQDIKLTLVNTGDITITGLRFRNKIPVPGPMPIRAGLEVGTARFTNGAFSYSGEGGSRIGVNNAVGAANWTDPVTAAAPTALTGSHMVLGLLADAALVSKETESLTISLVVGAAYRIVSLPDTDSLGAWKAEFALASDQGEADPVKNFNNLSLTVGLNIGF